MFDVDSNGDLVYGESTGSGNSASPPPGTLFSPDSEFEEVLPEESLENETPAPEESEADSADDPLPVVTGSGNIVQVPVLQNVDEMSITTSGDVYIYPEIPDAEPLAEARSVTSANVQGLPNATSLSYLEDVAAGYPSWYKYMAFKSDANYSQSMVLWIAPQGVKNDSQNLIDFTDVDCVEVAYVRSGTTNYYEYRIAHYPTYSIPYDSDVFLYTNVVDGYAQFDFQQKSYVGPALFVAFIVLILFLILRGGGKN